MSNKYTATFFIDKFKKIPEDKWITSNFEDGHGNFCALGHLGESNDNGSTFQSEALERLFGTKLGLEVPQVNDSPYHGYSYETPKKRILAALRDIQKQTKKFAPKGK